MNSSLGSAVGLGSTGSSVLGTGSTHVMLGHQPDSLGSINSQQHLHQQTPTSHQSSFSSSDSLSSSRLALHPGQQSDSRLPALSTAPMSSLTSSLSTSSTMGLHNSPPSALSAQFPTSHLHNPSSQFPIPATPFSMSGSATMTPSMLSPGMYQSATGPLGQLRPYRPWGAELAY